MPQFDIVTSAVREAESTGEVCPWIANPYCLVSWWDMLQFSARGFYWAGQYLEHIKGSCLLESVAVPNSAFDLSRPLPERTVAESRSMLETVESQCRSIELHISADTAAEVRAGLNTPHNCQWLLDRMVSLQRLLEKETKGKVFFYSPPERAKFFPVAPPFGEDVADAFPSSIFDVHESAVCLAMARGTASVFHLMRVLEIGLAALGKVFGVSLAHTNWEPALREIESKIREMHKDPAWKMLPDCKEKQEAYAQAASHFGILKDAWRNYTMHVRGKYTEEEAAQIFQNTKGFMQKLSGIGLKETP